MKMTIEINLRNVSELFSCPMNIPQIVMARRKTYRYAWIQETCTSDNTLQPDCNQCGVASMVTSHNIDAVMIHLFTDARLWPRFEKNSILCYLYLINVC